MALGWGGDLRPKYYGVPLCCAVVMGSDVLPDANVLWGCCILSPMRMCFGPFGAFGASAHCMRALPVCTACAEWCVRMLD